MAEEQSTVVAFVGDSDIERWPVDLLPASTTTSANDSIKVYGQGGATLEETLPLIRMSMEETDNETTLIVVFCAGENDIGQGIRLDETLVSFRKLLDMMFPTPHSIQKNKSSTKAVNSPKKHLIVLGPKFEPWLQYDASCRKQYIKLSMAMDRACQKHEGTGDGELIFVDCLTMFCGESGQQPGAVLGGKGIPEAKLFDHDQLHLSREGYKIWNKVVENYIAQICARNDD